MEIQEDSARWLDGKGERRKWRLCAPQEDFLCLSLRFTGASHFKPDFLYVLASAKGFDRSTLLKRGVYSLWAGLPHYGKKAGLYIADREGEGFELVYLSGSTDTDEAREAGRKMFGHLKMVDYGTH